jgi:hypothetical protein
MRNKILKRLLMALALLILAFPVVASAQNYGRYDRDSWRDDRRDARQAIAQLDNASARLQNDLAVVRERRVFGFFRFTTIDTAALDRVRDFRNQVRELRRASMGGRDLRDSTDEARMVLDRGMQLDRDLRLRSGRSDVDSDLADLRSALHLLADAYDLNIRY